MDVDAVPGRTTLGVTTLLTVSSKSAGKKMICTNMDFFDYLFGVKKVIRHFLLQSFFSDFADLDKLNLVLLYIQT
jgi:hypothetical protein